GVGQSVGVEHRAAGSEYDRFRAMADDLVRRQVAVIFASGGTAAALAASTATSTIAIVFYMGGDPVQQGLVASLGRPGGNLTGFAWLGFALATKRLELLRELLPSGATIGLLVNPANPDSDFEMRDVQNAARILGRQIHILTASSDGEFDGVFATLVKQQIGALIVGRPSNGARRGDEKRIVKVVQRKGPSAARRLSRCTFAVNRRKTDVKKLLMSVAVLAVLYSPAMAQSWGRGGAYTGAGGASQGYYPRTG